MEGFRELVTFSVHCSTQNLPFQSFPLDTDIMSRFDPRLKPESQRKTQTGSIMSACDTECLQLYAMGA
eukprot:scaffold13383_cov75-Cyclotella_meneghiniana.AAC.9